MRANGDDEESAMWKLCYKLNVIQAQTLQEWRLREPHMRDETRAEEVLKIMDNDARSLLGCLPIRI